MRPLRAAIGDAARLLISPDGLLNLAPFEAFADEQGRYLIERYRMSYLSSGRDLLRLQVARESRSAPVIVADPLFGEPPFARRGSSDDARHLAAGPGAAPMYFTPLAGAAAEARAIKGLFPDAVLVTGREATTGMLQKLDAPKILHIASHGFFREDAARDANGNPLLWSGLALAGANLKNGEIGDDGLLTALEASGLNLWGTKLVTLSGCETGVGQVRNGEGVYGLRRAFVLAGTETLVMSLWPVSDGTTREMMTWYYTGLRAGLGRGDALRQAKLVMFRRAGREHPFYWASFIQSGEWSSLDHLR
jgi:CHAT domain-containing protein